jgi:hypothetical protein
MNRLRSIFFALIALAIGCASPTHHRLRFENGIVTITASAGQLSVRPKGGQPLLGETEITGGTIRFTPQFPMLAGETYEAIFTHPAGQQTTLEHTIPINAPAPEVTAVFPSTSRLPANHLKFYIHFSEPMERGNITRHFALIDRTTGKPVAQPFRETELWTEDGRRLTLWFHPGRQKTGVNLNLDLGPILQPNRRYELKISAQWKSQAGVALKNNFQKQFTTLAADRTQPNVKKWKLTAPDAHTRAPLQIKFPAPLDAVLLKNLITIEHTNGRDVTGAIELSQNETHWKFIPKNNWPAATFRVRVDWELEDLAGNNLARPFEVNLTAPNPPEFAGPRYLKFAVER